MSTVWAHPATGLKPQARLRVVEALGVTSMRQHVPTKTTQLNVQG